MDDIASAISMGGAARLTLDFLEDHFRGCQKNIDTQMFMRLDKGETITQEEALQFIHRKHANYCLLRTLQQKLQNGQSALQRQHGEAFAPGE